MKYMAVNMAMLGTVRKLTPPRIEDREWYLTDYW